MSFKQNILKKIEVNRPARQVTDSLIPRGDVQKIDKAGMRKLLDIAGFRRIKERDLELYALTEDADPDRILVLDNGLVVYHTTVKDVAMRKSPTVKEMVSIRNIIRVAAGGNGRLHVSIWKPLFDRPGVKLCVQLN